MFTDSVPYTFVFLAYMPYGEEWADIRDDNAYSGSAYKFNGKEKDPETGYNYDAAGERNYKQTGSTVAVYQNGRQVNTPVFDKQTLYASALITINDLGYTKHYFEESNRICSSIGSGGFKESYPIDKLYEGETTNGNNGALLSQIQRHLRNSVISVYHKMSQVRPYIDKVGDLYNVVYNYQSYQGDPEPTFYYHTDHLGSASYITDDRAKVVQQLAYMPYGEEWADIRDDNAYSGSAYKFNGKEKDPETGYNYYGARYYSDRLSIWLSVDPMTDKYPSLSGYNYCANNPVMLVDPDGRAVLPTTALKNNSSVYTFFKSVEKNSVFKRVMNVFYSNQSNIYIHLSQLKNTDGTPRGRNNLARTESHLSPNNPVGRYGQSRIIINSDILNGNGEFVGDQTFLFTCLLHEGLHAKMFDTYKKDNFNNFPGYMDFIISRPKDGGHHNQMGAFYRNTLIEGMKEFDTQMGTTHSEDWYEAVSWMGLQNSNAWRIFEKNNPEKANTYMQIWSNEIKKLGNDE